MHQIAASVLVLAAAVMGQAAMNPSVDNGTGVLVGLAAIALGLCGCVSLLGSSLREREITEGAPRNDLVERLMARSSAALTSLRQPVPPQPAAPAAPVAPRRTAAALEDLPADVKAQLSVVAHLQGKDHAQLIEEALRNYLPRHDRHRAA
ncbi:MAG: hypothetical protein U0795_16125 [Pirellulales bacterium]